MNTKPILGILLGGSTGVGPEIVTKTAANDFPGERCRPIIIGDNRMFENTLRMVNAAAPYYTISEISEADWNKGIPALGQENQGPAEIGIGKINADYGKAVNRMIRLACRLCRDGTIEDLSFTPLNKSTIIERGYTFGSGRHLIADIFGVTGPSGEISVLGDLMTIRATSHTPISAVSENLSVEQILWVTPLSYQMAKNTGVEHPVLDVTALNPHYDENGRRDREELGVIGLTVEKAREMGMDIQDPFSADILFIKAFRGDFHNVVATHHDQGQTTLKLKGLDQGTTIVNGQPYPIVTCAHGTAYDIVEKGVIHTSAFENMVKMTTEMTVYRRTDS